MAQANPTDPRSSGHQTLSKAHSVLANPQTRQAILDILKHEGQGDDTDIVHVNAQEEAMLKAQGGSGTINSVTGLRQYDPTGGSNAGGAGHAGDSGNNGGKGGGGSGTIGGGIHDSSDGTDDGNTYGSIAGMGYAGTTMPGSSTPLSDQNQNGTGWNNADAMARADVNDEGNSTMDNIGNFIGSLFGGYQQAPSTPIGAPMPTGGWQTDANWGVDPAGLVGGIAGAAFGIPGLGTVIGQISALLGHPFGINLGPNPLQGLKDQMAGLSAADKAKVQAGISSGAVTPGAIGQGGQNNPGGNGGSAQQPLGAQSVTPPPVTDPAPPVDPNATYNAELGALTPNLQNDFNFQAGQRGLNPTDYTSAFNAELQHRLGALPVGTNTGTDKSALDTLLSSTLSPNFGNAALDDYQTSQRAGMKGGIDSKGSQDYINNNFADGSASNIIDKIYNEQYGGAKGLLDNTKARGGLNDLGYSMGISDLDNQGKIGRSTLNTGANNILASDRGTLNTNLSDIYNKIGGYTLGKNYDPTSDYDTNFTGKGNALLGDLEGSVRGIAPSIFNTSTLLQKASNGQGATSGGSLLDTLAQRSANSDQRDRGLGTTGAF